MNAAFCSEILKAIAEVHEVQRAHAKMFNALLKSCKGIQHRLVYSAGGGHLPSGFFGGVPPNGGEA